MGAWVKRLLVFALPHAQQVGNLQHCGMLKDSKGFAGLAGVCQPV